MRFVLLTVVVTGIVVITAPSTLSAQMPRDGVSCGAIHASDSQGVHTFSVRAVGVSCALAKKTTTVWAINDCGSPADPPGNRVLRRSGNQCVVSVPHDPGSSKPLANQRTYVFDCRATGSIAAGTAIARCTYLAGSKRVPLFVVTLSEWGE